MQASPHFNYNDSCQDEQSSSIKTLAVDAFPYLKARSLTVFAPALLLLNLLLELPSLKLYYAQPQCPSPIFTLLSSFIVQTFFLWRLGSEYEQKLGVKNYLSLWLLSTLPTVVFICINVCSKWELLSFTNMYAIYVFSLYESKYLARILSQKWQVQPEGCPHSNKANLVESVDLLDLNNTIIKFKPQVEKGSSESMFEFYNYNIDKKIPSYGLEKTRQQIEKNKMLKVFESPKRSQIMSKPIIQDPEKETPLIKKLYKLVFLNFLILSSSRDSDFWRFLLTEALFVGIIHYDQSYLKYLLSGAGVLFITFLMV